MQQSKLGGIFVTVCVLAFKKKLGKHNNEHTRTSAKSASPAVITAAAEGLCNMSPGISRKRGIKVNEYNTEKAGSRDRFTHRSVCSHKATTTSHKDVMKKSREPGTL